MHEIIYLCIFPLFLFGFCVFHLIKFRTLKSEIVKMSHSLFMHSSVKFRVRSRLGDESSLFWVAIYYFKVVSFESEGRCNLRLKERSDVLNNILIRKFR